MSLFRLKIRELIEEKNWTVKEVSERSGVHYSTLKTYARSEEMTMADVVALIRIARVLSVTVEELVEIIEE
ncbi:helix-turn-helix transcriptional regulator [Leptolyngbya sp. FACHB-17]|uniref:helix-turn-helix domain-containing protein n=1 Tax=unclassified Leptolyngbya TaxID=2650499 RepID=UPI0016808541|nr:helix-turn-helix transcriptional regulator [Leptolyngbya sp. FACHB-17]MBD2080913.1 helix-turn-helix transcriptional regulator [Leptolyngbya sp. FACHB-17]